MSKIVLKKIKRAESMFARGIGVIGWEDFGDYNGLFLINTNSIHTYFVRFPLDLVFVDKELTVVKLVKNLKPFRLSPIVWESKHVLEMPAGSIEKFSIKTGNKLDF